MKPAAMREISSDATLAIEPNSSELTIFKKQTTDLRNSSQEVTSELPMSQKHGQSQPNILCSKILSTHQLLSDGDNHLITSINQHFLRLGLPQCEEILETEDDEVQDFQSRTISIIGVLRMVENNLDKLMSSHKDITVQRDEHQKHFGILERNAIMDSSAALILQRLSDMESNLLQSTRVSTNCENPSPDNTTTWFSPTSIYPSVYPSIFGFKPNLHMASSDTNGKQVIYQQPQQAQAQDEVSAMPSIGNQENEEYNSVLWAREFEEKAATMHRELGEITSNCKDRVGRLEQEIAVYRQRILENMREIERLHYEVNERNDDLEKMKVNYEGERRLREEIEKASDINMVEMTEQWNSEKNRFITTVEELEAKIHNLQSAGDLSAAEITHLTTSKASQLNIIEEQKTRLSNLDMQLAELEDTVRDRDSIITNKHQSIQSLTDKLATENERWSTIIQMKDDAIKNITKNTINLNTELEIVKKTLDRQKEFEETLYATSEDYKARIVSLDVVIKERESKFLSIKQELVEAKSCLDDEKKLFYEKMSKSEDKLKRNEAEFQCKIFLLEATRTELSSHLNDAKNKCDDLTRHCNELDTKLRDKTVELDKYIADQTQQKIENAQRADAREADFDKLLANALAERDRFKEDYAAQSSLLLEAHSEIETLHLENESLQVEFCEIQNSKLLQENDFQEMTKAKGVCEIELSETQSLHHHSMQDLNIANNKLEGLQKDYEDLIRERDDLLGQCDQLRAESLETQRGFDNHFDKIQTNLTQTQEKLDQSNDKIKELDERLQKNTDLSSELQAATAENHRQEVQRMIENECKLSEALLNEEKKYTSIAKTLDEKQQILNLHGNENTRLGNELAQAEAQLKKLFDENRSTENKLDIATKASVILEVSMDNTQKSFAEERERWNSKEESYIDQLAQLRKEKDNEIIKTCDLSKEVEQNKSEFESLKNDIIVIEKELSLTTDVNQRKNAECVGFKRCVADLEQKLYEQAQYVTKLESELSDLKIEFVSSNGNGQRKVEESEHQKEIVDNLIMQIQILQESRSNAAAKSLEGRDSYIDELEKYLLRAKSALELYHKTDLLPKLTQRDLDKQPNGNKTKLTRAPINTSDSDKHDIPTTIRKRRLEYDTIPSNSPKRTREDNSPDNFQSNTRPEDLSMTTPTSAQSKTKRNEVVVYFSGFKENQQHSTELKEKLANMVIKLGGSVITDGSDTFDEKITHMVTPPNSRTLKTFAAVLTSKWLIQKYHWIIDSYEAGDFLPEDKYGVQYFEKPFKNKVFFMAPSFFTENSKKSHRFENCRSLIIDFGQGKITQNVADADYILKSSSDECDYGLPTCTWQTLISMIPGSQILHKK